MASCVRACAQHFAGEAALDPAITKYGGLLPNASHPVNTKIHKDSADFADRHRLVGHRLTAQPRAHGKRRHFRSLQPRPEAAGGTSLRRTAEMVARAARALALKAARGSRGTSFGAGAWGRREARRFAKSETRNPLSNGRWLVATKDRNGRKDAGRNSGGSRAARSWRVEGRAPSAKGKAESLKLKPEGGKRKPGALRKKGARKRKMRRVSNCR